MNIDKNHISPSTAFQGFLQTDPSKSLQCLVFEKGLLRIGDSTHAFTHYQESITQKLNPTINKINSATKETLENLAFVSSHDSDNNSIQIVASSELVERVRAHIAKNKQITIQHADGRIISHDVNNISIRTFTSEEYTSLERALNQYFALVLDARKKTMESKEKGGNEVDYKAQYPTVEGAKIKNTNKLPKEQKKLVDPDTIRKTAINIVAKNIAKSATQEKQKQLDQDKEDKIKETELQRSERRQEILNESKENQQEKIAINKEDQKIHAKTKHQKI